MGKHILILGGGIIGMASAYYCAQRGHQVTVLERRGEEEDTCSTGNAGMIVPSHFVPLAAPGMVALGLKWMFNPESPFSLQLRLNRELLDWVLKFWRAATPQHVRRSAPLLRDLNLASRTCFEELAALPDTDFGLVKGGLVMICKTQRVLEEEARFAALANGLGVPARVLDGQDLVELDPRVTVDAAGGVYFPKDCHLVPERFIARLKQAALQAGVKFAWKSDVTGFTHQGGFITAVRTSTTTFAGDEIVLAGGAWTAALARDLRLDLPLQAGKGYSLTLDQPRQLPTLCAILTEARVAVTPMAGRLRFAGTLEISDLSERINPRRVQGIIKNVPKYYPAFSPGDFKGLNPWCGLRPCTPDGLPYLGRTRRYRNLAVACGHAMMGLSLGPVTGQLISQIVSGEAPAFDLGLLSPDRYS